MSIKSSTTCFCKNCNPLLHGFCISFFIGSFWKDCSKNSDEFLPAGPFITNPHKMCRTGVTQQANTPSPNRSTRTGNSDKLPLMQPAWTLTGSHSFWGGSRVTLWSHTVTLWSRAYVAQFRSHCHVQPRFTTSQSSLPCSPAWLPTHRWTSRLWGPTRGPPAAAHRQNALSCSPPNGATFSTLCPASICIAMCRKLLTFIHV